MIIGQRLSKHFLSGGERTRGVLSGSALMLLSTIVSTLTRVGLISLLARIYSKDQFGVWVTVTSVTAVMATSDFGIGNALRNKLSELRVKNDTASNAEAREYFLSVVYFFLAVAILISLFLIILQNHIPYHRFFKVDDILLQKEIKTILLTVQIIFLISIPLGIGSTMFFAYQESKWVAVFNILNGVLTMVVIGIFSWMGKSVTTAAILFFFINLLISVVGTAYFLRLRKWNVFQVKISKVLSRVGGLLIVSFKFALLQISGAFIYNAITLVASSVIGVADAAELNLVQKLYTFVIAIYLSLYNPLWAGYSDAIHRGDWLWVRRTLTRTMLLTLGIFGSFVILFNFSGNLFLQILAGRSYSSNGVLFLLIGFWALTYSLYSVGVAFLSASGRISMVTILTTVIAFAFVPFATYYSREWGIRGISFCAAVAFSILTCTTYYQSFFIIKKQLNS